MTSSEGTSAIFASVAWIRDTLLGTAATSIAVICVAAIGYQFLTGRVPRRRAITAMFGAFILFGAGSIARSLQVLAADEPPTVPTVAEPVLPQAMPTLQRPARDAPNPFDPYAGQ